MIPSEWLDIAAVIQKRWPATQLPKATVIQWGDDLSDLPAEHVRAGVDALARSERQFAPGPGDIRREVIRLSLDAPEWGEALSTLRELAALPATVLADTIWREDGSVELVRDHPRSNAIAREHPVVGKFISLIGWDQIAACLRPEDHTGESQLREKWRAYVSRLERDLSLEGLEGPALPALERRSKRKAPRSLAAVVRDLRDAGPAELEAGDPEAA